ncbi:MAG: hypothetical protein CL862_02175 [Cyanobium sp. NAT70]|nr:hypothetical protein [Cyanobium sp. NAT70]
MQRQTSLEVISLIANLRTFQINEILSIEPIKTRFINWMKSSKSPPSTARNYHQHRRQSQQSSFIERIISVNKKHKKPPKNGGQKLFNSAERART